MKKMRVVLPLLFLFSLQSCVTRGFWGKVIDQHENPVPGVDILYMAGLGSIIAGGPRYGHCTTDTKGMFLIESPRGFLDFREMKKEGYQIALYGQERLFGSHESQPADVLYTDYTKDNPYIFHAWKYSDQFNKEKLIHDKCTVYFRSDGIEYSIDLYGPPKQRYNQDISKGQLRVLFYLEPGSSLRNSGPWQLVLTASDGGIMEAESLYTNEAPTSGYQESVVLSQKDYEDGRYGVVKSFYLRMEGEDGPSYARLSFKLNPYLRVEDGIGSIYAKYTINPTGERYLDTYDY
jgi:hypothetical protein